MAETSFNLSKVTDIAIKVITQPAEFYRGMPKSGGYAEPIVFLVVMAAASGLLFTVMSFFGIGMVGAMAVGIGSIIFIPIFALIGGFIGAAILFVVWKLTGSNEPYETAFRCVAYASAIYPITALAALIPYIGSVIGIAWGLSLMAIASIEVHGIEKNTAYIVFGILALVFILINISSERAARRMQASMEHFADQAEQLKDMTPEEAGKALGEFFKGFEKAAQEGKSN